MSEGFEPKLAQIVIAVGRRTRCFQGDRFRGEGHRNVSERRHTVQRFAV